MVVIDSLYTYGYKERKIKKLLCKISHGEKVRDLYVVVIPVMGDGLLEIYPYNQLLSPFYKSMDDEIKVVGAAKGKSGAVSLIVDMVQDIYDSDCGFDVNRFFEM